VFASQVGGEQLHLVEGERPRVVRIDIGVDSADDLDEVETRLQSLGYVPRRNEASLEVTEQSTEVMLRLTVTERLTHEDTPDGRTELARDNLVPRERVRPLRLCHIVLGCPDIDSAERFFLKGLGMRLSDHVTGSAFMRFETDHHNIVVVPAPFALLHHTAWKVRNVDEVGYGGSQMIAADPDRHAWGLGRHAASANYFWYLRDPAGAFAEYYYSEMDELAPSPEFWDPDPAGPELPVAVWASPALVDAPLTPPLLRAPRSPEGMTPPLLENETTDRSSR